MLSNKEFHGTQKGVIAMITETSYFRAYTSIKYNLNMVLRHDDF